MNGQEPAMIFGRVTRGDGAPLTGAALTLCDLAGDQLDRAGTDEGGHYRLSTPTGGTYLLICSSGAHGPQASLVALSDRAVRHDVTLAGAGASLSGTVGSRRGGPTGGAAEMSGSADVVLTLTDVRGTVVTVARSGADGSYRFADLAEGAYTLTAATPQVPPVAETVQVPADGEVTHDIALPVGARLAGVVRSARAGRPVGEALTTLVGEDGNVVGSAVTGDDGTFGFDDVAEGVYTITASGYAPVAAEIQVGPGHPSEVVLTLMPPLADPSGPGAPGTNGTRPGTHWADRAEPDGHPPEHPRSGGHGDERADPDHPRGER